MIEPLLLLLLHSTAASLLTKPATHFSDLTKIKCEALPYRSKYLDASCFFVIDVTDSDQVEKQCSKVLVSAKIAKDVPDAVWRSLLVDKSEFTKDGGSRGMKKAMCLLEKRFSCSTGAPTSISGKCVHEGDKKMTYRQAESFCSNLGSLPSSLNDIENRDVAAATKSPMWLRPTYSKDWSDRTTFSRFSSCAASPFKAAKDPKFCDLSVAAVANPDKSTRGYWVLAEQTKELDVVCVGDADSDFWTAPPKSLPKPANVDCKENHNWSGTTGRCEWTGPGEACAKIFSFDNQTEYVRILGYPGISGADVDFHAANNTKTFQPFVDKTVRAIIRQGCMATFWSNPHSTAVGAEIKLLQNVEHGDYSIPCWSTGKIIGAESLGLSRVSCYCDPYETEKQKPEKKECAPNHEWDEEKEKCVWSLDEKYAGSIQTFADKKMLLEIPNWPFNKRFDVNLRDAKLGDYENKVNKIVVRQGCFCTIYSGYDLASWQPRTTINYGSHGCASRAKPTSNNQICDSLRIVCECLNEDTGKELWITKPDTQPCIDMHAYNETTKRCEWAGRPHECMKFTNTANETAVLWFTPSIAYNKPFIGVHPLYTLANWNRKVTYLTVRRGCVVNVYSSYDGIGTYYEYLPYEDIDYGTYRLQQKDFGDVEGGYTEMAGAHFLCHCDPVVLTHLYPKPPPTVKCVAGHVYDPQTGQCEWTRNKDICAVIRNDANQTMDVIIPNWPKVKRFNWLMNASKEPDAKLFNGRIRQLVVRQHCFVTLLAGPPGREYKFGTWCTGTVPYGVYDGYFPATRVQCDCTYNT